MMSLSINIAAADLKSKQKIEVLKSNIRQVEHLKSNSIKIKEITKTSNTMLLVRMNSISNTKESKKRKRILHLIKTLPYTTISTLLILPK